MKLLEMKEAWKRQRDGSNSRAGFIIQERALWRGLQQEAAYTLGVDTWEWRGNLAGWENSSGVESTIARGKLEERSGN
jgi:hypothetical protein